MSSIQVAAVESVGMTVAHMERSLEFYTTVLDFKQVFDVEVSGDEYDRLLGLSHTRLRVVRLQLGNEILELTEYLSTKGRPMPADSRSHDQWFQHLAIVVSNIEQACQRLEAYQVQQVSIDPQTIPESNPVSGGVKALYFQDPDGHRLELIEFPLDKGEAKWQQSNQLFLGIDHTAIVVFSIETSLQFYRDCLKLELKTQSKNSGTEQENLSKVQDAKVCVSSLKALTGLGIELLEYLKPCTGRPMPVNVQPNDVFHWQITIAVPDVAIVAQQLQSKGFFSASSKATVMPDLTLGFKRGILVRDPDGHGIRLIEK
ncbi:MAG: VOC family protein [Oscillatoriophycideae cyanobacterium NC_groundwater_1537_Pr4_S-0.65um_50_18]|nr:VOC family protein [Oscillatoriophycideae cyanobacterium NC_groundwater_1537_Pr4_S-0.65um_50_18]